MWIDFEGLEEGTIPAALFVEENDVARTQGVRVAAARGYAEGRGIQVETPRASVATLWFSGLSTTKATLSVRLRAIEVTSRFGIVLAPDLVPDPMLRLAERRVSILFDNAARAVVVIDANPESVRELQRVFVPDSEREWHQLEVVLGDRGIVVRFDDTSMKVDGLDADRFGVGLEVRGAAVFDEVWLR